MTDYYGENYRAYLPMDSNAAILDIGCGDGALIRYLHGLGYRNITGIDPNEQALASFRELDDVTQIVGVVDAEFMRKLKGRYDLIVMKQMIYYLDRSAVVPFVQAVKSCLKEDGKLIVEIFNGATISGRFTEIKDPGILTAYSEISIRRLLEWNGYKVVDLFGFKSTKRVFSSRIFELLQRIWFSIFYIILILERGRDDELPRIWKKTIIAVAEKHR